MDLVKTNKVKEYIRSKDKSMSSTYIEELNKQIEILIDRSIIRAEDNSRKTIFNRDL